MQAFRLVRPEKPDACRSGNFEYLNRLFDVAFWEVCEEKHLKTTEKLIQQNIDIEQLDLWKTFTTQEKHYV